MARSTGLLDWDSKVDPHQYSLLLVTTVTSAATGGSEHTLYCKFTYLKNQRNPSTIKAVRYLNVLVTIFLGLIAPKLINLRIFLDFIA